MNIINRATRTENIKDNIPTTVTFPTTNLQRKIPINTSTTKKILLWDLPSSVSYPDILPPSRCGSCSIIRDRRELNSSDAVVFHFNGAKSLSDLPPISARFKDQVYIWMCRESPRTTKEIYNLDLNYFNNVFNWTMTHRLDSDVFYPYAEILHRMHDSKIRSNQNNSNTLIEPEYVDLFYKNVKELLSKKEHLVAWVVGNCGNTAGARARMALVDSLSKYGLPIHKFGRCFKNNPFPPYRSEETHEILMKYKFYLAFENTFKCRDYVTYKFWKNAFYSGAVPIVWGSQKSDLMRMAPKGSFLHIEDFVSVGHLVNYLKYIDSNDTAYQQFFLWRKKELDLNEEKATDQIKTYEYHNMDDWIFSRQETFGFCKLCRKLHAKEANIPGETFQRKSITSLHEWWYNTESKNCFE